MIRIRRVKSRIPFLRSYEIELSPHGWPDLTERHITWNPTAVLEPLLGIGDAWTFVHEADRHWGNGKCGWAVEFEEEIET